MLCARVFVSAIYNSLSVIRVINIELLSCLLCKEFSLRHYGIIIVVVYMQ